MLTLAQTERVAVISDIHGNRWALEAVLADIAQRGVDLIVNLGDTVWGSLDPAGTVDLLQSAGVAGITGNQDRTLWQDSPAAASADRAFVIDQLGPRRLAWLQSQPPTQVLGDLFLCHGTPQRDDEYLLERVTQHGVFLADTATIAQRIGGVTQPVILCGHSHRPALVWLPSGQIVVNPGSVGIPAYDDDLPHPHVMESGSPHARYAILSRGESLWSVEHIAVPYPWREAAAVARRRGRHDRAGWIETGRASPPNQ